MRPTKGMRNSRRYSFSDCSVSIVIAERLGSISRGRYSSGPVSNARARSPFSSFSHSNVRLPCAAPTMASAAATLVLPTPPLPVTKSRRRSSIGRDSPIAGGAALPAEADRSFGRRARDLDVGDLADRYGDVATLLVGQPQHLGFFGERVVDRGLEFVAVDRGVELDQDLLGGVQYPDTNVHVVSQCILGGADGAPQVQTIFNSGR